jgi:hypothetical protein
MLRHRPRLLPMLATALFLGFLAGRLKSDRSTLKEAPPAPVLLEPAGETAKLARFIKRYALAELATLIALPLALFALLLTALATRDTARQLEASERGLSITQAQIQPTFRIKTHDQAMGRGVLSYDWISLTVEGDARITFVDAISVFAMLDKENNWSAASADWWQETEPGRGEVVRWSSNPKVLKLLLHDRTVVNGTHLGTIIFIQYEDIAGVAHERYFGLSQAFGATNWHRWPPGPATENDARSCLRLMGKPADTTKRWITAEHPITVASIRARSITIAYSQLARCVGEPVYG